MAKCSFDQSILSDPDNLQPRAENSIWSNNIDKNIILFENLRSSPPSSPQSGEEDLVTPDYTVYFGMEKVWNSKSDPHVLKS